MFMMGIRWMWFSNLWGLKANTQREQIAAEEGESSNGASKGRV
jgi:hypothetical protein